MYFKFILVLLFGVFVHSTFGQTGPNGHLQLPFGWSNKVYLSVIYDYREMTNIQLGQIIASTPIDSNGYFSFEKEVLLEKELIYRLHVVENAEEVEVFLADFSEEGIGYNHIVFQAKKGDKLRFNKGNRNQIFGPITATNKDADIWQFLINRKNEYNCDRYGVDNNQQNHLTIGYLKDILEHVSTKGNISKLIACEFLLFQDVNLSSDYLYFFEKNKSFFTVLESELGDEYDFYTERLTKEIATIQLQLDGDELLAAKKENKQLYILISLMTIGIVTLVFFLFKKTRNKITVDLTVQEAKIQKLILEGKTNKEIAEALFISVSTVKTHINTLYQKQNVSSRKELIRKDSSRV